MRCEIATCVTVSDIVVKSTIAMLMMLVVSCKLRVSIMVACSEYFLFSDILLDKTQKMTITVYNMTIKVYKMTIKVYKMTIKVYNMTRQGHNKD